MLPGRKPKPTSLKKLNGNPGHRPLNDREPQPKVEDKLPPAPGFLSRRAKVEWRKLGRRLLDLGLLTQLDETLLAMFCVTWDRWREAIGEIAKSDAVIQGPTGIFKQSPWVGIANEASRQMLQQMNEFGMTPSSRSRLKVEKKAAVSDLEYWFGDAHRN